MTLFLGKLLKGSNRKLTFGLLPGLSVAGIYSHTALRYYWEGYHFDYGTPWRFSGVICALMLVISVPVFLFNVLSHILNRRFTKKWSTAYFITFALWWVCCLPCPRFVDGMEDRLRSVVSESMLLRLAEESRKSYAIQKEFPEESNVLERHTRINHPYLDQLSKLSPVIRIFPDYINIVWEGEKDTFGIRIMDKTVPNENDDAYKYSEFRKVYPRVWVHEGYF